MRKLFFVVSIIAMIFTLGGICRANYLDPYASTGSSPSDPNVDVGTGVVTWGADWTLIDIPFNFVLAPGNWEYLGLSNKFDQTTFKTVTLKYTSNVQLTISGTLAGDNPPDVAWNSTSESIVPSGDQIIDTITGIIGPPQPWWEWIKLTNNSGLNAAVTLTEYTSVCPEPSAFALLGLGAASLLAYGWRRRNH